MKKMVKLLSAVTMALTAGTIALSASAAASHNYKGDINRDDKVDITDVVFLQKYITGKGYISDQNLVYADVSGDGKINVVDLLLLKRLVISEAAPEEAEITTPAVTTTVTTAKTTAAATAATTASTSKISTTASTSASTSKTSATSATSASTSKTSTAASTSASTSKTSTTAATTTTKASTTTTTTTTKATTTTTTTTTTKASTTSTTTTTTATTAASEAATSKTYPAKVGNGVNSIAPESVDRAFIILGGDNNICKYDESTNINDFVPGSVQMPEITGDKSYKASFYVYDEALVPHGGSITFAHLKLLKAGTWETYSLSEKPDLKLTVTGATIDGQKVSDEKISALTQSSDSAAVQINSILGPVNSVEIEFTVEGFGTSGTSTPSSGSTRTVTIASDKTYASSDMNNWSLSDVIGSGETIENIVIRISPVSGNDTIGGINFNLRTPDYVRINQNIQTTVSDAAYTFSLADVLDESGKEKLSTVTGSDEIILQSYWLQNGNIKIDSIEVTLKS